MKIKRTISEILKNQNVSQGIIDVVEELISLEIRIELTDKEKEQICKEFIVDKNYKSLKNRLKECSETSEEFKLLGEDDLLRAGARTLSEYDMSSSNISINADRDFYINRIIKNLVIAMKKNKERC